MEATTISQPKDGCLRTQTCKVYIRNPVLVGRISRSSHLAVVLGTHSNHGAIFFCGSRPKYLVVKSPKLWPASAATMRISYFRSHRIWNTLRIFLRETALGQHKLKLFTGTKTDAKTKLGNSDPMYIPCDWRLTQKVPETSCNYNSKREEIKLQNGTPQLSICSIGPPSNLAENMATECLPQLELCLLFLLLQFFRVL